MNTFVLALLSILLPSGKETEELKMFQGSWERISLEKDGKHFPWNKLLDFEKKMVINGRRFAIQEKGKAGKEGEIEVHPSRTPKEITFFISDRKGKGVGVVYGIYKFEKNRLIICTAKVFNASPTKFHTEKNDGIQIEEYRKRKKDSSR